MLTALALLDVLLTDAGQARRKVLLWVSAVLLRGFGIYNFGDVNYCFEEPKVPGSLSRRLPEEAALDSWNGNVRV